MGNLNGQSPDKIKNTKKEIIASNNESQIHITLESEFHEVVFRSDKPFEILVQIISTHPIEFNNCEISLKDYTTQEHSCPSEYEFHVKPNDTMTISKDGLDKRMKSLIITAKNVISGCDKSGKRDIVCEPNMPIIYHSDEQECTYRLINQDTDKMLSLNVDKYPDDECKINYVVSHTKDQMDYIGQPQVAFNNISVHKKFDTQIYLVYKYSIVKIRKCQGGNSYELKVDMVQS